MVTDELILFVLKSVEKQTTNLMRLRELDLSHPRFKQEDLDETVQHCIKQG